MGNLRVIAMSLVLVLVGCSPQQTEPASEVSAIDVSRGGAGSYSGPYPAISCARDDSHYAVRGPISMFGQIFYVYFWRSATGNRVIGQNYCATTGQWDNNCYDYSPFDRVDPATGWTHNLDVDSPRNVSGFGGDVFITADYGRYYWFTHDAYTWLQMR